MKNISKILASAVAAATLVAFAAPASAKLSDADVARLGADLTPMGAEKLGLKPLGKAPGSYVLAK